MEFRARFSCVWGDGDIWGTVGTVCELVWLPGMSEKGGRNASAFLFYQSMCAWIWLLVILWWAYGMQRFYSSGCWSPNARSTRACIA